VLNPLERLGVGEPGTDLDYASMKRHPFFNGIDWDKLLAGKVDPNISEDLIKKLKTGQ